MLHSSRLLKQLGCGSSTVTYWREDSSRRAVFTLPGTQLAPLWNLVVRYCGRFEVPATSSSGISYCVTFPCNTRDKRAVRSCDITTLTLVLYIILPVASLGLVSPGAATDGVTLFFLKNVTTYSVIIFCRRRPVLAVVSSQLQPSLPSNVVCPTTTN